ncbi:hypothetical protein PISMIDRAFT_686446 [Pisolithus microcarpus 441]|uniref:Unplaced genomic scaffold scaffold_178, whole genome shotgun sequence n=1 Tax=Pisolithus microcarpus 441 TaxID=765257 RepID=A0A0C9Z1P8_9AGAM|nr:hypothetical protein BKA83DRAFT_686446 [Pisolithus microcarpus]KIK16282.1 hypothetical protein PISMIDRAFT_686446 [Pisolithus microcarpus 441]
MSHASAPQTSANYVDERGNFSRRKTSTLTGPTFHPHEYMKFLTPDRTGEVLQDSFHSRNVSCRRQRRVCTRT